LVRHRGLCNSGSVFHHKGYGGPQAG